MSWRDDQSTARERDLQYEIDRLRDEQERAREREDRAREERRRERYEEVTQAQRHADTWPEALMKQMRLCRAEAAQGEDEGAPDKFFTAYADACEKALELWPGIEAGKQAEIERLETELAAVRDSIRLEVADQLAKSDPRSEFSFTAEQMRDDDIEDFLNW